MGNAGAEAKDGPGAAVKAGTEEPSADDGDGQDPRACKLGTYDQDTAQKLACGSYEEEAINHWLLGRWIRRLAAPKLRQRDRRLPTETEVRIRAKTKENEWG